jgi:hypothetical protein
VRLLRDTCRSIRDLIPLHVGGDLDAGQARRVDEHLHLCLTCFREYKEMATMRGRLGTLAEQPLPAGALDDFTEQVMARISMGEAGPAADLPGVRRRVVLPLRTLAAAASLLVALSLGLALGSQWSASVPAGDDPAPAESADLMAASPFTSDPGGFEAPTPLPALGIPVGDFKTNGMPAFQRSGNDLRTISSQDSQLIRALPPGLRPMLMQGSADGLVPDTDPGRRLRLRDPNRDQDG